MKAIILAGGRGTRLKPYTTNFPKPLMPIGEKPILEILINQLKESGIKDIILTVGHLAELIMSYFGDGSDFGVNIIYSREKEPLGTAGPLDLVRDELDGNFLLINGDVLTDIDFQDFLNFNAKNDSLGTVAVSNRKVDIDFGVVKLDGSNKIIGWDEKPKIEYFVSMGIYAFNSNILDFLPHNSFFNVPDLIVKASNEDRGIISYKHEGFWLDIGREEDYMEACEVYGKLFAKE